MPRISNRLIVPPIAIGSISDPPKRRCRAERWSSPRGLGRAFTISLNFFFMYFKFTCANRRTTHRAEQCSRLFLYLQCLIDPLACVSFICISSSRTARAIRKILRTVCVHRLTYDVLFWFLYGILYLKKSYSIYAFIDKEFSFSLASREINNTSTSLYIFMQMSIKADRMHEYIWKWIYIYTN